MNTDQAYEIQDEAWDLGVDIDVREDYSGRGMYGKKVVAFVTAGDVSLVKAAIAIGYAGDLINIPFQDLPTRVDSMGRGYVIY